MPRLPKLNARHIARDARNRVPVALWHEEGRLTYEHALYHHAFCHLQRLAHQSMSLSFGLQSSFARLPGRSTRLLEEAVAERAWHYAALALGAHKINGRCTLDILNDISQAGGDVRWEDAVKALERLEAVWGILERSPLRLGWVLGANTISRK